jgi:hypothetical protein
MNGSGGRKYGAPDLSDYKVINELTRRVIARLISKNPTKHVIVCAHEKYDRPSESDAPGTESLIGPELSGQLFTAAPSMFDFVLRLRTRSLLRDPNNPKSRVAIRYFQTNQERGMIVKCRALMNGKALLDAEEIFDLETGAGGFPVLLEKITTGYKPAG